MEFWKNILKYVKNTITFHLFAIVLFVPKYVYLRFIGTHAEYNKIEDCSMI